MKLTGSFDADCDVATLLGLVTSPQLLSAVPTLTDVRATDDGAIAALFSPVTSLGRIPLDTVITPGDVTDMSAAVRVVGRRGNQVADVDLLIGFEPAESGTRVRWESEVKVGGCAASVGQRVIADLAGRAISDVLEGAANAAAAARAH